MNLASKFTVHVIEHLVSADAESVEEERPRGGIGGEGEVEAEDDGGEGMEEEANEGDRIGGDGGGSVFEYFFCDGAPEIIVAERQITPLVLEVLNVHFAFFGNEVLAHDKS